jgi:hypothetical protein
VRGNVWKPPNCDVRGRDPLHVDSEEFFQHKTSFDRSSLTRGRQRKGEEKLAGLIQESLATAARTGAAKPSDFTRVIVDTTVQPKAVAFPTDAKLMQRARERLVRLPAMFPAASSRPKRRQSQASERGEVAPRLRKEPPFDDGLANGSNPALCCPSRSLQYAKKAPASGVLERQCQPRSRPERKIRQSSNQTTGRDVEGA